MLGQTMKFLLKNRKVQTIIDATTGERRDKTEYPVVALQGTPFQKGDSGFPGNLHNLLCLAELY